MTSVAEHAALFREELDRLADIARTQPPWLQDLRREARFRFEERGFPTTREEGWRHTSLAPLLRTAFGSAPSGPLPREAENALASLRIAGHSGPEVVFVNGRHAPELSSTGAGTGVAVTSLREAILDSGASVGDRLGRVVGGARNVFADLNAALFEDGALVLLADGTRVSEPVHLVFLQTSAVALPSASHPRTLLVASRGSQGCVVESYGGADGQASLTNAVTEVVVEAGASLEHVTLQRQGRDAFHTATLAATLGRDAAFTSHWISLGGSLVRQDVDVTFGGAGGDAALYGLFMTEGAQHMDVNTRIDHAVPHCSSRELYKGVLDGRSRGVFAGRIVVRKDAQKTDAYQTNKNLLLSAQALVDSTPALEIHADDVKCKHGSTTGQLDAAALFYLRSRGLDEDTARGLLTYAFASDVAARVPVDAARALVQARLAGRLPRGMEAREVLV
jgi:Fe-S cluster assembly protein SufD